MNTSNRFHPNEKIECYHYQLDGAISRERLCTPVEQDIDLMVNGEPWITFMCTPIQLQALAIGFLYNENVIQGTNEIASWHLCDQDKLDIWLTHGAQKPLTWERASGCAGGKSGGKKVRLFEYVNSNAVLTPAAIIENIQMLFAAQELYHQSRGVHCSALSDGVRLRFVSEDIGRHNTYDKLTGQYLLSGETFEPLVLLTTGRVSSEMMQKAARLGSVFVISHSSPTNRSIKIAEETGVTLIGYARRNGFNVYTHHHRVQVPQVNAAAQPSEPDSRQSGTDPGCSH